MLYRAVAPELILVLSFNIKNPAGDYVQRDSNVEVARQVSQAKARREKQEAEAERQKSQQEGSGVPSVSISPD